MGQECGICVDEVVDDGCDYICCDFTLLNVNVEAKRLLFCGAVE